MQIYNYEEIDFKEGLNIIDKILLFFVRGFKLFYEIFYFHCFPYLLFPMIWVAHWSFESFLPIFPDK